MGQKEIKKLGKIFNGGVKAGKGMVNIVLDYGVGYPAADVNEALRQVCASQDIDLAEVKRQLDLRKKP